MLGQLFGAALGLGGGQSYINGQPVSMTQSMMLASIGLPLMRGARYWYDKTAGLYGFEGGPTMGQGIPNMPGFAELQPNASNGMTGVFINGRHLPIQDVMGLQRMGIPWTPGRYWMNSFGQYGYENSPYPIGQINLGIAVHGQGGGGGYGGTTQTSVVGGNVYTSDFGGGDGYYFDSSNGNSWYPGK